MGAASSLESYRVEPPVDCIRLHRGRQLGSGGYLISLMGYAMMGIFSSGLLVKWGVIGLAEMMIAGLVGAWLYREE